MKPAGASAARLILQGIDRSEITEEDLTFARRARDNIISLFPKAHTSPVKIRRAHTSLSPQSPINPTKTHPK